jgi:uncharacterized membrane protein
MGKRMMIKYSIAYAITALVFFAIDFIWLSRVAKRFYFDRLGELLLEKPHMGAAAAFYAVYIVGIIIFAVAPALRDGSALTALMYGALFGFFAYATYDMTNYATLRNWSLTVSLVDIVWGTCLTGTAAFLGYFGTRFIFPA